MATVITGTGSYIPENIITIEQFKDNDFYTTEGKKDSRANSEIMKKFIEITGIKERRYVNNEQVTSDIATIAARNAIESSGINPEDLDEIIVATNFYDIEHGTNSVQSVPVIASKVKCNLRIKNPYTVAYDLPFGCPGWLHAVNTADEKIRLGAKKILAVGAEVLSRIIDPHDVDCMIYSDGAGAVVLENRPSRDGIFAYISRSDTISNNKNFVMGPSYKPGAGGMYAKMVGHDIYKYATRYVPKTVSNLLSDTGVSKNDITKVLMHQANERLDKIIMSRIYGKSDWSEKLPMTIEWLGNSSVATIPTMLDLMFREKLEGHKLRSKDLVLFASVGAGMNINAMLYRMP